ncbi:MAG: Zn-ribbon domain-containing OB-fold protein [Thermoplasmata archaeon]|nr:Zn-ribbon domain-containing OB-fold protein [Thermoplasmata archaeon]
MSTDSPEAVRPRTGPRPGAPPLPASTEPAPTPPTASASAATPPARPAAPKVPTVLDFYPMETAATTRVAAFFDNLRAGRFTTTRCRKDGTLLWPPRVSCPECHGDDLDWVDLPPNGHVYAFSAVLLGAPLGMESEVPFVVGLVDLDGAPLRLFGRIDGGRWETLRIGDAVHVVPVPLDDGRIFYRFVRDLAGSATGATPPA